jgi:hypothetical protein
MNSVPTVGKSADQIQIRLRLLVHWPLFLPDPPAAVS